MISCDNLEGLHKVTHETYYMSIFFHGKYSDLTGSRYHMSPCKFDPQKHGAN